MFKALWLEERDGQVSAAVRELHEDRLPKRNVLVSVEYSTLNYKDGMILKGLGKMVRTYPHVPGIDLAGTVEHSDHPDYRPGDPVALTGWRVGELHWGGYAEKARVDGDWLVPLPKPLDPRRAMAIGTAGFTAMIALMTLEEHAARPDRGPLLVTGAAGGVGSVAVCLLSELGFAVSASTGRMDTHDYLRSLGAGEIIDRTEIARPSGRPLDQTRFAGCIDNVGGDTLACVLSQIGAGGSVAAVGLAGGRELNTTVLPFLLRGINLLGIDSGMCPGERRREAWQRLADTLPLDKLDEMTTEAALEDLPALADEILAGKVRGRVVVDVNR